MTDMELAEEIQAQQEQFGSPDLTGAQWDQIVIALRRGPERIDAKMAELLVDTTWRKAVGQCINSICGLDGKSCDRLFISRERFDEHIAPLLRERPPSGEMVMVPREPSQMSRPAAPESETPETGYAVALRSAREVVERDDRENAAPSRVLRPGLTDEYRLAKALLSANDLLEREGINHDGTRRADAELDRVLTMTDEEVRASLVAEGIDPDLAAQNTKYVINQVIQLVQLRRELTLAQTEIKGHMRIEDDLKADIERERMRVVGCSVAALGNWKEGDPLHADYDCVAIRDVAKLRVKHDEAQARIAELEKVLRGVIAEADRDTDPFIAARALLKDRA